ncbi:MAG: hypothetical protein WBA57_14135 [Elainellaceae cyanobacterium]
MVKLKNIAISSMTAIIAIGAIVSLNVQAQPSLQSSFQDKTALKSGTDEIRNPLWLEVPGTESEPREEFGDDFSRPYYVEVNGLTRRGVIATADIANPDGTYSRLEVDCSTYQYQAIRFGSFDSEHVVSYISYDSAWSFADNQRKRNLLRFICNR